MGRVCLGLSMKEKNNNKRGAVALVVWLGIDVVVAGPV